MKVVFMGTPDFSVPVLQSLYDEGYNIVGVVTQPDKPKGRKRQLTPPPVKVKAEELNIPVYQPIKIRLEEEYKEILALEPDLIVTAAYGQILPNEILDAPKFGCINVHASLLPELRGGAPIHYSIIQGKSETGVTIMYMVERLDAGDMISKVVVPIEERDDVQSLHDKLSVAGAKLLLETIPQLLNGSITPVAQNHELATFAPNIKREQELINWNNDGEVIYNHIRGLRPWPVAYTILDDIVWKVWWGEKVTSTKRGKPGEIIDVTKEGIIVATGNDTCISITELQVAGKKRMTFLQYGLGIQKEELIGKTFTSQLT